MTEEYQKILEAENQVLKWRLDEANQVNKELTRLILTIRSPYDHTREELYPKHSELM